MTASTMLQLLPSGGPLFALQWSGRLCPCLEKEEDRNARQALQSLRCHAARILWKTGSGAGSSSSAASGSASGAGFLSSLFQGAVGGGGGSSASSAAAPARLVVQDDENGEPEFFVDPIIEDAAAADDSDSQQAAPSSFRDSGGGSTHDRNASSPSVGYKLHVLVRRVDRVTLEGNDVVLLAKKLDPQQPAKQLLRFELLGASSSSASAAPATSEQRNVAVHHLSVLVEWERQRRISMGYHDGNGNYREDEDDDQPNFLAARAQKAAHFARRELELQQTRRDREKRKAKLVQETGGLKYTALAMANRGESA
jgi:hypothetical protein